MELALKYNEHATHSLNAAFIRGNNPAVWLQEMSEWQIPLTNLVCFIISHNNNPVEAAGLFVVFNKEQKPRLLQVKQPYTVIGGRLYIPIDAELTPAITEQELQSLLIWYCQVLHPTLGFIGFEKKDRIALPDLLQYDAPKEISWEYAQEGNSPWIPLHQITLKKLTPEEVFDSVKESINSKPLTDIPKANKRDVPAILNNKVVEKLFKGAYKLLSRLISAISNSGGVAGSAIPSSGSASAGRSSGNGKPGIFSKMMNWMQQKIEDLEKQRDSELKRLSDMYDKNMDEFLQYAIPLSSPYMNRGTAAEPGAQLVKRDSQFNPGRLGGGQAVDGWNLDKHYNDLRSKYLRAANYAINQHDYKKAAYVYAHLLGDYAMAASVLKQGKHYREAAILYKDHLHKPQLAAECYREGGLYNEAIEVYTELQEYEKAGDLYVELGQQERANTCYEEGVNKAKLNNDYLEQSRIIADKIGERPRAKKVLLEGWQDEKQPEACLTKYFDLLHDDNKEQLHEEVQRFYAKDDLENKKLSFLNVIDGVNKKYKTSELQNACKTIAYEVVSEEVSAGNKTSLHQLRNFIDDDQLLTPDCYRFIHTSKSAVQEKPQSSSLFKLVREVAWKKVVTWQNQTLVWGVKPTDLVLARVSAAGQVEYFGWPAKPELDNLFVPVVGPYNNNTIVLYTYGMNTVDKKLLQNNYFQDELMVFQPQFLHSQLLGIGMHDGDIVTLHNEHEEAILNRYLFTGELLKSIRCTFKEKDFVVPTAVASELIWCEGFYYLACLNRVWRISESGVIDLLLYMNGHINKMVVQYYEYGVVKMGLYSGSRAYIMTTADDYYADPFEVSEEGVLIRDICFADRKIVIADDEHVRVYGDDEVGEPVVLRMYEVKNGISAIFEGTERNQLGIIDRDGKITFHVIN